MVLIKMKHWKLSHEVILKYKKKMHLRVEIIHIHSQVWDKLKENLTA